MTRFALTLLLLVPSLAWAEPGTPMPDDVRRAGEQATLRRESDRMEERARQWIQEGRKLVSCEQFDGSISKITIASVSVEACNDGTLLYWLHKDNGDLWSELKVGEFIFRDNFCKHPQNAKYDPRKIQKRIKELQP